MLLYSHTFNNMNTTRKCNGDWNPIDQPMKQTSLMNLPSTSVTQLTFYDPVSAFINFLLAGKVIPSDFLLIVVFRKGLSREMLTVCLSANAA